MLRVLVVVLACLAVPAGAQQKAPSRAELDKLLAATDDIAAKVSKLRGLPLKKPIARGVMSRKQVEDRVKLRLEEEYAAIEIAEEERAMKRLGLFPADKDYKQVVLELLADQIAGFYDPAVRELYIADWIEADFQRMVMAHEIAHALQDQSYDLRAFVKPVKDNSDEQLARQALVEGDGIAVMIEFLFREGSSKLDPWASPAAIDMMKRSVEAGDDSGALKKAPLLLRDWLLFPYVGGVGLVAETRRLHAWSRIDDMYRKPPASTEQVLHPEKYFAGEGPVPVRPAALPSLKGWKPVYTNVLGEMVFSVFFRQHGVDARQATRAAAGWGGDRYVVYAPPTDSGSGLADLVVVDQSSWDSEAEAVEALEAGAEAVTALATGSCTGQKESLWTCADGTGDVFLVERKGARVLFLMGAPSDKATRIRTETWARWKR